MKVELHNPKITPRWLGPQRRIGITGGVASGKSSVGKFLQEIKGIAILDADTYSKEALGPKEDATKEVIKRYGNVIQTKNEKGYYSINRKILREIIFANSEEKLWLEELIHPIVKKRLYKELDSRKNLSTIALIIPLLFETNLTSLCSEIWVVSCSIEQQIERLINRDSITRESAENLIKSQWPLTIKVGLADFVINNCAKKQDWIKDIENLI